MDKELEKHIVSDAGRLDRIEQKIDRLSETVISLARAEEKLIALEGDKNFIMERMLKNEERVDSVERKVDETNVTIRVINRLFWIVVVAAVTGAVGMIFMN